LKFKSSDLKNYSETVTKALAALLFWYRQCNAVMQESIW